MIYSVATYRDHDPAYEKMTRDHAEMFGLYRDAVTRYGDHVLVSWISEVNPYIGGDVLMPCAYCLGIPEDDIDSCRLGGCYV